MNSFSDLKDLFWQMAANILSGIIENPDKYIRRAFPTEGAPDWKITDNIVFLNLDLRNDEYAKQWDSTYTTEDDTVIKTSTRTRVWDLSVKCYGPRAFDMATAMFDGVFSEATKNLLDPNGVFLVPNMDRCVQANELFAGQWWERWDVVLTFNEKYSVTQDVGHLEEVPISISYQP